MHEGPRTRKNLLDRLLARYLRVTPQGLVYFVVVGLIMATSEPNLRSLILGSLVVSLGFTVRIFASGYRVDGPAVGGIYRWVRYPKELGVTLVLAGLALCGKQIDVILMIIIGCSVYFAFKTKKKDLMHRLKAEPESLVYQKLVPALMPSVVPLPKKMVSKMFSKGPEFSLRSAFFGREPQEVKQIEYIIGHFLLLLGLFLTYRYWENFPFNKFFAFVFGSYAFGRLLYFTFRGDRRGQHIISIRD